jgi:predicted GIY-YIG superfamily endonuclease/ribosomal protein S14
MAKEDKIYALRLKSDKYYIGRAGNVLHRIDEHRSKDIRSAAWIKEYDIIDILEVRPMLTLFDEDVLTEEYMEKYGIDNVRNGVYSTVHLSKETKDDIQREIWRKRRLCIRCGRPDHMIKTCKYLEDSFGNVIRDDVKKDEGDTSSPEIKEKSKFKCEGCGKVHGTVKEYTQHIVTCKIVQK